MLQVLIHKPSEFPNVISQGFTVGLGEEAYIAVNAQRIDRYSKIYCKVVQHPFLLFHNIRSILMYRRFYSQHNFFKAQRLLRK